MSHLLPPAILPRDEEYIKIKKYQSFIFLPGKTMSPKEQLSDIIEIEKKKLHQKKKGKGFYNFILGFRDNNRQQHYTKREGTIFILYNLFSYNNYCFKKGKTYSN